MNEDTFLSLARVLVTKIHDLTSGFAALFNLSVAHGVFDESEFHEERLRIEASHDLVKLREFVERLSEAKAEEDFEALLRDYKGPPH
ncbi:MAG TPA: hypothetical protein VNX18_10255 [Bryobacteraceae bacterium]|jgi:hypothetical protein|nr:hypothetical protein [Bryobacteraceae bacterium]